MSTTAEFAYHSIRKKLFQGGLVSGQRVSQVQIARELGCSTVPVVEALRRLESDGLLIKEPRKMAKVRVLVAAEVKGLYLLRQALEMTAIELCIQAIEDQEIEQLEQLEQQFEQAAADRDVTRATQFDMEIHRFIVRCARCPLFQEELDRLMLIERTVPGEPLEENRWKRYGQSHRRIIEAIVDRDQEVGQVLMKKHIQNGYEETLERIRRSSRMPD